MAIAACITAPPPDLPKSVQHRPTILHDSVIPPPGEILTQLPEQGFIVPVELDDPNQVFSWDVFVDYDPVTNTPPTWFYGNQSPSLDNVDGGVVLLDFGLVGAPGIDNPTCHKIQFLVAHQFNASSPHTWDAVGGDIVEWFYNPVSGSAGCPVYDAGALQDGAFPEASSDSSPDGLPLIPDAGIE